MPEILEYTWDQYLEFSRAAQRGRNRQASEALSLLVVAARGDEKSIKKTFDDLTRD